MQCSNHSESSTEKGSYSIVIEKKLKNDLADPPTSLSCIFENRRLFTNKQTDDTMLHSHVCIDIPLLSQHESRRVQINIRYV